MTPSAHTRSASDRRLVDLIDQIAEKMRGGEAVRLETCVREHPDYADRLRELFPALELMADLSVVHGDSSVSAATGFPSAVASSSPVTGVLGDFRILREIGRGGMGVVYEAEQISLGRRVALKVLPFAAVLDPRQLQRFQNEARAAASLKHPHIVSVYSVGCERGVHYYAMDFVQGRNLAQVVDELHDPARPTADPLSLRERARVKAEDPLSLRAQLVPHASKASCGITSIRKVLQCRDLGLIT